MVEEARSCENCGTSFALPKKLNLIFHPPGDLFHFCRVKRKE